MLVEYVIFLPASSGGGSPLAVSISLSVISSGSLSLLMLNDCDIGCAIGVGALLLNGVKLKIPEAIVSKPPPNIPLCASPVCCAICVLSVMLVVPVVAIALVIALRLNLFVVVIDLIGLMGCSLLDCSVEVVLLLLSDFLHFV